MFCPKCGQRNEEGSVFCFSCGNALQPVTPQPVAPQYAYPPQPAPPQYPPQSMPQGFPPQPPRKKRTGLIVGLVVGGVLLIAAALALVFLLPDGPSVVGTWYNESNGIVLDFRNNGRVYVWTADDETKGEYEFDKRDGEGVIFLDDEETEFTLKNGRLVLEDKTSFRSADDDFDIDEFIAQAEVTPSAEVSELPSASAVISEATPTPTIQTVTKQTMTLLFAFGERTGTYTGDIVDGLPHGYGTFESQNPSGMGWTYEGQWENGHFSGQGTTYYEDGWIYTGYHEADVMVSGQIYTPEYLLYDGELLEYDYHGFGTYYNPHGEAVYSGYWNHGFLQETAEDRAARLASFQAGCYEPSMDGLYQECADETGAHVQITGTVFFIYDYADNPTMCECLIYLNGVESADTVVSIWYLLGEDEPRPVEGQQITVWGTAENLYSYTSESDDYLTVPNVEAWFVE